jgi:hypothetical protein
VQDIFDVGASLVSTSPGILLATDYEAPEASILSPTLPRVPHSSDSTSYITKLSKVYFLDDCDSWCEL